MKCEARKMACFSLPPPTERYTRLQMNRRPACAPASNSLTRLPRRLAQHKAKLSRLARNVAVQHRSPLCVLQAAMIRFAQSLWRWPNPNANHQFSIGPQPAPTTRRVAQLAQPDQTWETDMPGHHPRHPPSAYTPSVPQPTELGLPIRLPLPMPLPPLLGCSGGTGL